MLQDKVAVVTGAARGIGRAIAVEMAANGADVIVVDIAGKVSPISKEMAGIDIAILSTHTESGEIANRPMSNNGDVAYDGTSYYFTYEQARAVTDIQRSPKVALGFSSKGGIFTDGVYVSVEGIAELIRDKAAFHQHWTSDLDKWLEKGVDTPGIVLIKVKAKRATCWKDARRTRSIYNFAVQFAKLCVALIPTR